MENRVLSRAGARTLSDEEIQQIAGGFKIGRSFASGLGTGACNYDPVACRVISGDCSDNPPPCLGQLSNPKSANVKGPVRAFFNEYCVAM